MAADEDAPPQLELGLGLAPALGAPAPAAAAANGQLTPATATAGRPEHGHPGPATDAAAPDAFENENIATAFRDHDVPLDSLDVRAVSPPRECARDYLELRRGRFSGFIACFPHGRDLYVGWTFFLRMSPGRLMLWSIGRSVQHLTRRGGDIQRALWFESTRALVAAMHSAALAGVSAAVSAPDSAAETADSADDVVVKFG